MKLRRLWIISTACFLCATGISFVHGHEVRRMETGAVLYKHHHEQSARGANDPSKAAPNKESKMGEAGVLLSRHQMELVGKSDSTYFQAAQVVGDTVYAVAAQKYRKLKILNSGQIVTEVEQYIMSNPTFFVCGLIYSRNKLFLDFINDLDGDDKKIWSFDPETFLPSPGDYFYEIHYEQSRTGISFAIAQDHLYTPVDEDYLAIYDLRQLDASGAIALPRIQVSGTGSWMSAVRGTEHLLFVLWRGWEQGHLTIYDLKDPGHPLKLATLDIQGMFYDAVAWRNFLYTIERGSDPNAPRTLSVLDISDPSRPRKLGSCPLTTFWNNYLAAADGIVYATTSFDSAPTSITVQREIQAIDVSNPAAPALCGWMDWDYQLPYGVQYVDGRAYVTEDLNFYSVRYAPTPLKISGLSRPGWRTDYLRPLNRVYTDRDDTFVAPMPARLKDRLYIIPANADKDLTSPTLARFSVSAPVTLTVALDARISPAPAWLKSWSKKSETLRVSDAAAPGRVLYEKRFAPGTIQLGPNREAGMPTGRGMYSLILTPDRTAVQDWRRYP